MPNPFTLISGKPRFVIYAIFAFVALAAICWHIALNANGVKDPAFLNGLQAVLEYLSPLIGVLAASNVPASTQEVIEAVQDVAPAPHED